MGGCVGLTIRQASGVEHRMCRWTDTVSWAIKNTKFVDKDPDHLAEVLSEWQDMRADWLGNAASGNFRYAMTAELAPYDVLAPREYGLVVVDVKHDAILSAQNYTSLEYVTIYEGIADSDPEQWDRFLDLHAAGRVPSATCKRDKEPRPSLKWIIDSAARSVLVKAYIDLSPFRVETFNPNTARGLEQLRSRILELGFKLTEREQKIWQQEIAERREEEPTEGA